MTNPEKDTIAKKTSTIHILWDGDFGGIQRIVKNVFLDDAQSAFNQVAILAAHFGPVIGPGPNRFCLGMKNGFDALAFFKILKILRSFENPIIVYHLDTPIFRFFIPAHARLFYLEHGCSAKRERFKFVNRLAGRLFFNRFKNIICISDQIRDVVTQLYPGLASKTIVIKNPVTISFGKPRHNPLQSAVIGFIGRFSPEKGPKEFILFASRLFKNNPKLSFRMIGDGPLLPECMEYASNLGLPIDFKGAKDDIAQELQSIDIVAVTSAKDAFNMVIIEAMANGVPVAAFPVGGIPEIISNNVNGILSEAGTPDSLVLSIERLLGKNNIYADISVNAFEYAKKKFSLHLYRKRWNEMFNSTLQPDSR